MRLVISRKHILHFWQMRFFIGGFGLFFIPNFRLCWVPENTWKRKKMLRKMILSYLVLTWKIGKKIKYNLN